jgi:hypothetical protein
LVDSRHFASEQIYLELRFSRKQGHQNQPDGLTILAAMHRRNKSRLIFGNGIKFYHAPKCPSRTSFLILAQSGNVILRGSLRDCPDESAKGECAEGIKKIPVQESAQAAWGKEHGLGNVG